MRLGLPSLDAASLPAFLAHRGGLFRQEKVSVQLIYPKPENVLIQELAGGEMDLALISPLLALRAFSQGKPLRAILAPAQRTDLVLVVWGNLRGLEQLSGRWVLTGGRKSLSWGVLLALLESRGVEPETVTLIPTDGSRVRKRAFEERVEDAALLRADEAFSIPPTLGERSNLPIAHFMPYLPSYWLLGKEEVLVKRKGEVLSLVKAIVRADRLLIQGQGFIPWGVSFFLRKKPALFEAYKQLRAWDVYAPNGGLSTISLDFVRALALRYGLLGGPVRGDSLLDFRFQEEAIKALGEVSSEQLMRRRKKK
ncbi:MAG: ABC transporter substrate-binding protein [Nitrospinota bacterium]